MPLPVFQANAVTDTGNIIPSAVITVTVGGSEIDLFEDREGNTPLTNPFNADADGFFRFYCAPGRVRIEAEGGGRLRVWEDVVMEGTAALMQNESGGDTLRTAATADVTTSNTDTDTSRVMRPGNFGWGTAGPPSYPNADLDDPIGLVNGNWRLNTSIANNPFGNAAMIAFSRISSRQYHIAIDDVASAMAFRRVRADTGEILTDWQYIYHTGNLGESDTAWTTVTSLDNGWTGTVRYIKRGGAVTINFTALDGSSSIDNVALIIPSAYRPEFTLNAAIIDSTTPSGRFRVFSDGRLELTPSTGTTDGRGTIGYPVV